MEGEEGWVSPGQSFNKHNIIHETSVKIIFFFGSENNFQWVWLILKNTPIATPTR